NTLAEGYLTVDVVRDPFASVVSPLSGRGLEDVVKAAFFEALAKHGRTSLPLGVAQIFLGGLLVFVSVRALFGRRASTSFALQLVLANAALLVAVYALREPIRGAIVDAVARSGMEQQPSGMSAREFDQLVRLQWWWRLRIGFGVQLTALLLSGFALTRKAARELLTGVQPSTTDEF
ncbi:MAG TPA: hypothetical protein VK524_25175, partial [Polyangiaceae bacterium]|nr:hypothetical protein [Polyangiaceae bacterium]